jgi:nicotinamide mononucleotide transporter
VSLHEVFHQFITGLQQTTWREFIAVIAGILSVWFSRVENIWVYPTGLINTIIYIWLSFKGGLLGEASVNFYYTVMSVYGWILWTRKDRQQQYSLKITRSTGRDWGQQLAFFGAFYAAVFFALTYLKKDFAPTAIPWADAFASATAYTGMWLMAKRRRKAGIGGSRPISRRSRCTSLNNTFLPAYITSSCWSWPFSDWPNGLNG